MVYDFSSDVKLAAIDEWCNKAALYGFWVWAALVVLVTTTQGLDGYIGLTILCVAGWLLGRAVYFWVWAFKLAEDNLVDLMAVYAIALLMKDN
jgi:hypothetical protein